jgi:hypothetical protein
MTKKRGQGRTPAAQTISSARAARLFRLLSTVASRPKTRPDLLRSLKLDLRGFYRDLEKLRSFGIEVHLANHRYLLPEPLEQAISRLPFPDPQLNLRDALLLAKGRTSAHRKLRSKIERITGKVRPKAK